MTLACAAPEVNPDAVREMIRKVLAGECAPDGVEAISAVLLSDPEIQRLNKQYLSHDYPTDVLAFLLNASGEALDGEVYVSMDTARRQATEFSVTVENEVLRLVVHGVLHLCGHRDDTPAAKGKMLALGETYLEGFR